MLPVPRPAPDPLPPLPIDRILTLEALERLDASAQLAVWCAAHGITQHALCVELGLNPSQLSRVRRGIVLSAPLVAAIERRTGVRLQ